MTRVLDPHTTRQDQAILHLARMLALPEVRTHRHPVKKPPLTTHLRAPTSPLPTTRKRPTLHHQNRHLLEAHMSHQVPPTFHLKAATSLPPTTRKLPTPLHMTLTSIERYTESHHTIQCTMVRENEIQLGRL